MKTLILMRHAQAAPGDVDFQRPLTAWGRQQCADVSLRLKDAGLMPDHVLCSSAVRAQDSARIVAEHLGCRSKVRAERALYEASAGNYLSALQQVPRAAQIVLFVAHNPSISDLLGWLEGTEHVLAPAGYAVIKRAIDDWSELERCL
ncbi:MAG TPA: histidine phosphatase family protein [Polyangiaceae bacterium]|nr:histidine phosphatase family protein [Polyangiaceae bacterium]